MSFADDVNEPTELDKRRAARDPRTVAGPFDAQDRAARASGLDWHAWARRTLEEAATRAPMRLVGADRGRR